MTDLYNSPTLEVAALLPCRGCMLAVLRHPPELAFTPARSAQLLHPFLPPFPSLSICLPACLSVCLSVCLSLSLSLFLSPPPSLSPPPLSLSPLLSLCSLPPFCLSLPPSISLPIPLSLTRKANSRGLRTERIVVRWISKHDCPTQQKAQQQLNVAPCKTVEEAGGGDESGEYGGGEGGGGGGGGL